MTSSYDYAVIGGGIVGLATALRLLTERPGASLVVLEKEKRVAAHQTGHNSGVIHAGLYYKPGSLKARLCKAGATATREFCDEHGIPYRDTGKLIVATDDLELQRARALHERALVNGLDVVAVDEAQLREREPHVCGVGGLFLSSTGIVDYTQVSTKMAELLQARGGVVRLGAEVTGIEESSSRVSLDLADERLEAGQLVVCGGIQADRLAALAGIDVDFSMVPFRGEYYRLPSERAGLVSTLIYPVPDPSLPFLGVHLTLVMDGGITVGPNAVLGLSREGYRKSSVDLRDVRAMLGFAGFWRVVQQQWRSGLLEQWDSLYKPGYLRRVQKYCPELTLDDLRPENPGIRAQAVKRDGTLVEDFLFYETPRMLHVCNAPSPAATSAIPIASVIADKLLTRAPSAA